MHRTLLLIASLALPAAAQTGEDHLSLNGTWNFKTETAGSHWDTMPVPGNWDTANAYAHYSGPAIYRRDFTPPAAWEGTPVRLRFDAVYQQVDVQLNGWPLGSHTGGYTPFEFDVTNALRYGQPNTLTARADNSYRRGAWWPWGGISRDVLLIHNHAIRITCQTIHAEPNLATGTAKVSLRLTVRNEANTTGPVRLQTGLSLVDDPKTIWPVFNNVVTLPAHGEKTLHISTTLPANRVRLWDFDHPHLYVAQTSATIKGAVQHLRRDRFGIREIKVTKDQLLLNGEPVRLAGFNRVYDHRAWGNTEPEHLIRQDVDLMKRLGGNLMRIMHGAQSPALLDYLDEKGVLVFEEIPVWGGDDPMQREAGNATTKRWLRETIERDTNHPCIIVWSVGNELTGHFNYVKSMTDYVRQDLDPHRLAGYVSYSGVWKGSNSSNDPITFSDLTMHNCYHSLADMATTLRSRWPDKPVFFTEFGTSQIGASLDAKLAGLEKNLDAIRQAHPYVVGVSLWTFNDYRSPYKSSALSEDRTWGVVDSWRRPKRASTNSPPSSAPSPASPWYPPPPPAAPSASSLAPPGTSPPTPCAATNSSGNCARKTARSRTAPS